MSEQSQDIQNPQADSTAAASKRRRRTRRPQTRWSFVFAIAVVAAIGAMFSSAEPTGISLFDVIERALFAGAVTLFAACSRRWTWLILGGVATVFAESFLGHVLGVVALGFAVDAAWRSDYRDRMTGALIGALSAQVLLRTTDIGFFGFTAIVVLLTVATVIVSGYRTMRQSTRTRILIGVAVFAGFLVIAVAGLVYSAIRASSPLDYGITSARRGLDVATKADQVGAAGYWNAAHNAFAEADRFLSSPIAKLSYPIPVVSQHAQLAAVAAESGNRITETAATAATVAPYQRIRAADGRFDLDRIASMEEPVAQTADAMTRARDDVDASSTPWLLAPFRNRVDDYRSQLVRAIPQAKDALAAIRVAPEVLGANGDRHYLLLFGNPAESRGLGGFIGAWAQLDAVEGKLELVRHGKMGDLNEATDPGARKITGEPEYVRRYGHLQPARYLQNISASPDFPTVARVAEQLYPQAGGIDVDGVMYIDPTALAALLKLTGPVIADGVPMPLTEDNAAQFLMHDQYIDVPGVDDRSDLLSNAAEATFTALTERQLPAISEITSTMSPMMHQRRIMAVVDDTDANAYLSKIGLTGPFPKAVDDDLVAITFSNASANKADYFVSGFTDYTVRRNQATGRTSGTVAGYIMNEAPDSGGPDYVLGNQDTRAGRTDGRPFGSITLQVSFYTARQPTALKIDGKSVGMQVQREFGRWVTTQTVTIPPSGIVNYALTIEPGPVLPGENYRMTSLQQPIAGNSGLRTIYMATNPDGSLIAQPQQRFLQRVSGVTSLETNAARSPIR